MPADAKSSLSRKRPADSIDLPKTKIKIEPSTSTTTTSECCKQDYTITVSFIHTVLIILVIKFSDVNHSENNNKIM